MVCPVQIINFEFPRDANDKKLRSIIQFDSSTLQTVIEPVADKEICFISIAGPSRQGKSFLLSFILRYLESLETENSDWMGWDQKDAELEGFKWRNGIKPETAGMWLWSKPYMVEVDNKKIAVLVMDTQGTFDEYTTEREWSAIVGLSLLTSSTLIFNFFKQLQEEVLENLNSYIRYGLLALQSDEDEDEEDMKPFQKLVFLIRDWNAPTEHPYGEKGGRSFIKKKLEVKPNQPKEAQMVRKEIKKCFTEIDCFLMPDPGEKAKTLDFNGALAQIQTKFADKMESFINGLLNPDNLLPKQICGNKIKGRDLVNYFQRYVDIYNSEGTPDPVNLWEATAQITNENLVSKAKLVYNSEMKKMRSGRYISAEKLSSAHSKALKKATKSFTEAKPLGPPEMIKLFKSQLQTELKTDFETLEKSNEAKKDQMIAKEKELLLSSYDDTVDKKLASNFLDDAKLKSISTNAIEKCVAVFREALEELAVDELESAEEELQKDLKKKYEGLKRKNGANRAKAEFNNDQVVEDIVKQQKDTLKEKTDQSYYFDDQDMEKLASSVIQDAEKKFHEANKMGGAQFHVTYEEKMKTELEKLIEAAKKQNQLKKENAEHEANNLCTKIVASFEEELKLSDEKKFDDYKKMEENEFQHFVDLFEKQCVLSSNSAVKNEKIQLLKNQLASQVKKRHDMLEKNQMRMKTICKTARCQAIAFYEEAMKKFIKAGAHFDQDQLVAKHDNLKKDAMLHFTSEVTRTGCKPSAEESKAMLAELEIKYEELIETYKKSMETIELMMKNDAADLLKKYEEEISTAVETALSEEDLKKKNDILIKTLTKSFESKWCNQVSCDIMNTYITDFKKKAMQSFTEEALEVFNVKKDELNDNIETQLAETRKYYDEQMEKHLSNDRFIEPEKLDKLHKEALLLSISKCQSKAFISNSQESQLRSSLEKSFKKFQDRNKMNILTDPAIGIDLGTTFSCVAVYLRGQVCVIPNKGDKTTPSYVAFTDAGEVMGKAAKDQAHENPENTIFDAKRIIGRTMEDPRLIEDRKLWPFTVVKDDDMPKVLVNGRAYFPEEISSKVLTEMKNAAEDYLKCKVRNAVITVPAYFTDGQRQATKDAGELAGLNVLTIINEPTAAAIAYNFEHKEDANNQNILIYDLGGGTFDVAVLRICDGVIDVKSVDGDTHLGGEDFDHELVEFCIQQFKNQHGIDLAAGKDSSNEIEKKDCQRRLRRLRNACERQKVILSSATKVDICVDAIYQSYDLKVSCTREQFEDMNEERFQKSLDIVEKCLQDANMRPEDIDEIVLVGGSTRIPKIQEILSDFFRGKPLNKRINPDEAVAIGAAMQAAIKNGEIAKNSGDYVKTDDVIPMSLGVEVYGGEFSVIIPKNTHIPCKIKDQYKTAHNNQTSVQIVVYQGEEKKVKDNEFLGEFYLNGIPPADAGDELIDVELQITEQGILHVCAASPSSGRDNKMTIKEHKKRLTKDKKNKLLAAA